jgi:protein-S-isoprenylcysteine O-methyltransferase Ste14
MSTVALVLYAVALIVIFGVRSLMQRRRTGSTGFRGMTGTPADAGWWGGVLFVVAIVLGLLGPLLAVTGVVVAEPPVGVQVFGLVLALAGFIATLAGQTGMGSAWRIGVDPAERTTLVTTGLFGVVRNPVFSAMVVAQAGVVLIVPTWVSVLGLVALVVAVELQVRAIEEPYLRAMHGAAYEQYAAAVGRFVPGVGRTHARVPGASGQG